MFLALGKMIGMFIPDSRSRFFSIPDPGSGSQIKGSKRQQIRDPGSGFATPVGTNVQIINFPWNECGVSVIKECLK
jgi:hypothetical protein